MKKITGILYIREENETVYRRWEELTKEEAEKISRLINREAALSGGFCEAVPA